jgi:signal peptidase II
MGFLRSSGWRLYRDVAAAVADPAPPSPSRPGPAVAHRVVDDAAVTTMPPAGDPVRTHWLPLAVTTVLVVAVDQVSKALVRDGLAEGATTRLGGVIRLHHTRNDGILGGLVPGAAVPVGVLTIVLVGLGLRAYGRRRDMPWWGRIAAGLLLGGALGNVIDRLRLGYVTDFIARGDRNAFNLADLAIYAGIGGVVLLITVGDRHRSA